MNDLPQREDRMAVDRSWTRKFRNAFRGIGCGVAGESSFFAHFFAVAMVIAAATALRADRTEWCLLVIAITGVLTTEMVNSAIERLAKAVSLEYCPHLRDALDIGSGAVLTASFGAAVLGVVVLGRLGLVAVGWW
jgi:diacylglycerol kinase